MVTKRARLWLARGATVTMIVGVVVLAAATWYYSGEIDRRLLRPAAHPGAGELVLVAIDEEAVSLPSTEDTRRPGRWGIESEDGRLEIGEVVSDTAALVRRRVLSAEGRLSAGTRVGFSRLVYSDPESRGLEYQEVIVAGPLGDYPAWLVAGSEDTWVVFVHSADADRRESLRALPAAAILGMPSLVITYRDDEGAPEAGGRHLLGRAEWADLNSAVAFALAEGAQRVVLYGHGTGGAVAGAFLANSRLADRVVALVLDAPFLDPGAVVDHFAAVERVPGFIVGWAKAAATLRFGISWSGLDQLQQAESLMPILLFHGEDDEVVPPAVSVGFAEALPDTVSLVLVPGAGHGEAWNVDPAGYEAEVRRFLEAVLLEEVAIRD